MARRRYQKGGIRKRGKRDPVWELQWWEDYIAEDGRIGRRRQSETLGLVSEITLRQARKLAEDPGSGIADDTASIQRRLGEGETATLQPATPARRKRGPCLSRRTGQRGCIVQHSKTWDATKPCYGKVWVDTADGRQRKTVKLGVCRTKTIARQLLRDYIEREGINDKQTLIANTAPATTFKEQAERWISSLPTR